MVRIALLSIALWACLSAHAQQATPETQCIDTMQALYQKGQTAKADSVGKLILRKYPKGIYARNMACNQLYNILEAAAAEKAYLKFMKEFPVAKMGKNIIYDYAAYTVAARFASEGNDVKAKVYVDKIDDQQFRLTAYNVVGSLLVEKGKPAMGLQILKQGAEVADASNLEQTSPRYLEKVSAYISYANALYHQGQKDEALAQYLKAPLYRRGLTYAKLANEQARHMEAFAICDEMMRNGTDNDESMGVMKTAWLKANGNQDGFDEYVAAIRHQRHSDMLKEVKASMISEKAPNFELKDAHGNTVRLSDLRGKVVVIDFWATWCNPCKQSLPSMQKTLAKYKNDSNVVFLFVHTWERSTPEAACRDAKAYLDQNGFGEFRLLMDTKDPATKRNKVVTAYGVKGIPAKFVIDGQGNIRFKTNGFGGSDDVAVAKLSAMIEACR